MMQTRRLALIIGPLLVLALVGLACRPTTPQPGPVPTDSAHVEEEEGAGHAHEDNGDVLEVALNVVEGRTLGFDPSVLEVPAGQRVKLTLVNDGAVEHDLEIAGVPAEDVEASGGANHTENLGGGHHHADAVAAHAEPGESASVVFTPTQPGEYEFACTLPGHKAAGMEGKLVVTGEATGASGVSADEHPDDGHAHAAEDAHEEAADEAHPNDGHAHAEDGEAEEDQHDAS